MQCLLCVWSPHSTPDYVGALTVTHMTVHMNDVSSYLWDV